MFNFLFLRLPQKEDEDDAKHVKQVFDFKSVERFALYNSED